MAGSALVDAAGPEPGRAHYAERVDGLGDFLRDNSWVGWAALSAVLFGAEMLSLDFVLAMLGVGAAAAAVSSGLGAPLIVDVVVAIVVAVGMLAIVRPNVVRRMHQGAELTTGHAALVGRSAETLTAVTENAGRVHLAGETWTARSFDPTLTIEPGRRVEVFEIDGATAVVYPAD